MTSQDLTFLCDAMLGGLARWLRAAGYDAEFHYGIDDRQLLHHAVQSQRMILSSDGPLFERTVIRRGDIPALFVPGQLSKLQQLRFVFERLGLKVRDGRCMACGGELVEVPKHAVTGEAPPLAFRHCEKFWRCSRCGRLLWRGTHWRRIARALEELQQGREGPPGKRP